MMRYFTILLFVCNSVSSQSIDKIIQDNIDKTIDTKISIFRKTLDSFLVKKAVMTGTFNIDTIYLPVGGSGLYHLSLTGIYGNVMGSGVKFLGVRNINGVYSLTRATEDLNFSGLTGHTWAGVVINNFLVIRITSTVAYSVKWEYKRYNL